MEATGTDTRKNEMKYEKSELELIRDNRHSNCEAQKDTE